MKRIKNAIQIVGALLILAIVLAILEQTIPAGVTLGMTLAAYTKACSKNVAGNAALYITEAANVASITVTTGEISAITMVSGKTFQEVQADQDTIQRFQEGEGIGSNAKFTHRVEAKFSKPTVELNTLMDAIADASPCGILAIVTDGNGTSWLVGYNETDGFERPLRLLKDNLNSGATPSDEDGQVNALALQCESGYRDIPFDATIGATISGGTATEITYV